MDMERDWILAGLHMELGLTLEKVHVKIVWIWIDVDGNKRPWTHLGMIVKLDWILLVVDMKLAEILMDMNMILD